MTESAADRLSRTYPSTVTLLRRFGTFPTPVMVTDPALDDDRLRRVRDEVVYADDWRPAAAFTQEVGEDWDRRGHVLDVLARVAANQPGWVDAWVRDEPANSAALTVHAWADVQRAWALRGGGWAEHTDETALLAFSAMLEHAEDKCVHAAEIAGADPTPWVVLLWLTIGQGRDRSDFDVVWAQLRSRHPENRLGHVAALQYLSPKWYGSHAEMYEFARAAPSSAPWAPVLPLQAHAEYVLYDGRGDHKSALWWETAEVGKDLDRAVAWARSEPAHPLRVHDLSVVGYALAMAKRWSEAGEVFAMLEHRAYEYPWYYQGNAQQAYAAAHKRAMKAFR